METPMSLGSVKTTLEYFADDTAPNVIQTPTEQSEKERQWQDEVYSKFVYKSLPVTVSDVRGREKDFELDTQGFQFTSHNFGQFDSWEDAQQVRDHFYPQVKQLLLSVLSDAADVVVFDYLHRYLLEDDRVGRNRQAPAKSVHVDATGAGALGVLQWMAKQNAQLEPLLSYNRKQLINMWVALGPVRRDPLGLCDVRSVDYKREMVEIKMFHSGIDFSTCAIRPSARHRWFYRSGMEPGDVILLNIANCDEKEQRTGVPHASFQIPGTEQEPARKSIEFRAFAFYK